MAKIIIATPETCPHPDELCSECLSGQNCHPVIPMKDKIIHRQKTRDRKRNLPAWLADASASVRRSYGY